MQYSNNSNAAIRDLIGACPTYVGQYRQALVQIRERQHTLDVYTLDQKKQNLRINLLKIEQQRLESGAKSATNPLDVADFEIKAQLKGVEIEEIQLELSAQVDLVRDAYREIEVCKEEIARLSSEAGVWFENLPESEFQDLMTQEFKFKRLRWLVGRSLSPVLGVPPEALEVILEISDTERAEFLSLHHQLLQTLTPHFHFLTNHVTTD
jgi:hypothetical protein